MAALKPMHSDVISDCIWATVGFNFPSRSALWLPLDHHLRISFAKAASARSRSSSCVCVSPAFCAGSMKSLSACSLMRFSAAAGVDFVLQYAPLPLSAARNAPNSSSVG